MGCRFVRFEVGEIYGSDFATDAFALDVAGIIGSHLPNHATFLHVCVTNRTWPCMAGLLTCNKFRTYIPRFGLRMYA